ncbi:UPC2-like regulatory protein [Fusarium heterosporum]|uniref:UPC2-like regulatory protein n=1 Tax=Fusarium heterosporum TaxID=42747 RepID=A0A8H5WPC4_FUSHE|nr:UPC2-like regulatory protein [Fusarium heterosporum]
MNDDGSDTATVRSSGAKPRRAHKKAKTGCADCRKRRVKCSEEKPQCRACCRRGVECHYPSFPARSLSSGPSPATDETSPNFSLRYTTDAARYHNEGLQGFKRVMHQRSDDVADALFAWSSLNLFYVFAISGRLGKGIWEESGAVDRKDRLLGKNYIPMIRGIQAVLTPSYDILSQGALRELLILGNWDDIDPDKQLDAEDQYFCLTREAWKNNPDAATYEETLHILRRCRMFMAQFSNMNDKVLEESSCNRSWQGAFLFVPLTPERYFTLLQQRQPPALVLYAFYGALLHSTNDSWFMEGWGYDIVEVVDDLLGSYWRHWIAWPLEVVGLQIKT